jgi:hypothetical protein
VELWAEALNERIYEHHGYLVDSIQSNVEVTRMPIYDITIKTFSSVKCISSATCIRK